MNAHHFSTLLEHPADRQACWGRINTSYFGALHVQCLDTGNFDARMDAYELGPLGMFMIEAPSHRVARPDVRHEIPLDEHYKLVLQLEGHGHISQREREFHLHPGDWSLYDRACPTPSPTPNARACWPSRSRAGSSRA